MGKEAIPGREDSMCQGPMALNSRENLGRPVFHSELTAEFKEGQMRNITL